MNFITGLLNCWKLTQRNIFHLIVCFEIVRGDCTWQVFIFNKYMGIAFGFACMHVRNVASYNRTDLCSLSMNYCILFTCICKIHFIPSLHKHIFWSFSFVIDKMEVLNFSFVRAFENWSYVFFCIDIILTKFSDNIFSWQKLIVMNQRHILLLKGVWKGYRIRKEISVICLYIYFCVCL